MVFVLDPLPEHQDWKSKLASSLSSGVSEGMTNARNFAQQLALIQEKNKKDASNQKMNDKINRLNLGLGTIEKMRPFIKSSGGFTSNPINKLLGLIPGETQKERAELRQLGTSLIPDVAAGVSIRNQKEFDEYKKIITDPSSSPQEFEGALDALQDLMTRQLEQYSYGEGLEEGERIEKKKESSPQVKVKIKAPNGKVYMVSKDKVKDAVRAGGKAIK